ncbi:Lsr2 family protein [Streptomyces sp. NPDC015127]|uniref:histone-like nucleoid-structuring protein Lsr2 n=1 Tax=Streptomyces sp. NPDC015127 TaxID=3364939 RepID=UPI0036F5941E
MAQKVRVFLVDDIDGGKAEKTVSFALDGKIYEIDLSDRHADELRAALEPFTKAGRRIGSKPNGARRGGVPRSANGGENTAAIRAWAKENGYTVNDRGRVPAEIKAAYQAANA